MESFAKMFGKLGLVMIVVRDMERSVAFYRDVLGLRLLIRQDNWSQFDAGNIILGLHPEGEEVHVSPESLSPHETSNQPRTP